MKSTSLLLTALALFSTSVIHAEDTKLIAQDARITFFSSTPAEDIKSVNNSVVSTLEPANGVMAFSVPMQGFEFEKALMQKHFNGKDFLDTSAHPRATFKGVIANLAEINFAQDGTYPANVKGTLAIKGMDREVEQTGTITVAGGAVTAEAKFDLTLADFGIEFVKGKPSKNIAKVVEVTVRAPYSAP